MYYVYLIKSEIDNWIYVGFTADLEKRLKEHNQGKVRSTKSRKPFKLIYFEEFKTKREARLRELEIKKNAALKKELINKATQNKRGPVV